jgi:NADPH-dependent curcumin reductase CurA
MVGEGNFELTESPVPKPGDGEILVRNLYVAFEPAMRGWIDDKPSYIPPVGIGEVMRAASVAQVVESNNPGFKVGDLIQSFGIGWQDYGLAGKNDLFPPAVIPDGVPPTWPLGVLGITGLTAYFGLLDLGKPQSGETVVVSGAAGATGSVVGQIARIKGCRVVGIAGGAEKCGWLTDAARFDAVIDYKSEDVGKRLGELCSDGINVFFDNVGGAILDAALAHIAQRARIVLCGAISTYNEEQPPPGPRNLMNLVIQRGRMEGFVVIDYAGQFEAATGELAGWVMGGEIAHREDIQEGFENIPKTFLRLFSGQNQGKQLLRLADPD